MRPPKSLGSIEAHETALRRPRSAAAAIAAVLGLVALLSVGPAQAAQLFLRPYRSTTAGQIYRIGSMRGIVRVGLVGYPRHHVSLRALRRHLRHGVVGISRSGLVVYPRVVALAPAQPPGHRRRRPPHRALTVQRNLAVGSTTPDALITGGPSDGSSTTATSTTFTFTSDTSGVRFRCSLDAAKFHWCTSPITYSSLSLGVHTFQVQAVSSANTTGSPTSRTWTVAASTGTSTGTIGSITTGTSGSTSSGATGSTSTGTTGTGISITTDNTPPTAPNNLTATAGDKQVALSWGASTDDVSVAGYDIYRNGVEVAQAAGTSFTDTGLTDGASYSYYVTAYDGAGNVSSPSNTVSVTPTATTTADPSGQAMPVGDVAGWHQVFADAFTTPVPVGAFSGCSWPNGASLTSINCTGLASWPSVEANLFAYPDGWSDSRYAVYYPSRVLSIANGVMDYYIHTETLNGTTYHMTSAPVPKIPGGSGSVGGQLYGRYAIRARFDSLPGYHVAFLLWPDSNNWPADGEIDFPDDPFDTSTLDAFVHYGTSNSSLFDHFGTAGNLSQWHTYQIDWTSAALSFYLDGNLLGTETAHIPRTPMHWVFQTDTWSGESAPRSTTVGHVQIDWAVAYVPA